MDNLAGMIIRLMHIKNEFGETVYQRASHAASIAIARSILDHAQERAAELNRPPCKVIQLALVPARDDEERK
jgi:hypothetical protein